MSIASLLSIKVTSPITHMVSSAVRGVVASLLGMWIFHDIITTYVPFHKRYNNYSIWYYKPLEAARHQLQPSFSDLPGIPGSNTKNPFHLQTEVLKVLMNALKWRIWNLESVRRRNENPSEKDENSRLLPSTRFIPGHCCSIIP
jgi:hypothetical protein